MKLFNRKTPADAPKNATHPHPKQNEVTVIIMRDNGLENYHETFLCDLSTRRTFEFNGKSYSMPVGKVTHYNPSFWQFGLKFALFFEQHKLWAKFLDWGHLRDHAVYEVGYIYKEGQPEPLKAERPKTDFALECWNIRHNTIIEKRLTMVGHKLSRLQPTNIKWFMILAAIMIVVIGGVIVLNMLLGTPQDTAQQVQNVTSTISPSASPMVIGAP